jgi:hypothetical protein
MSTTTDPIAPTVADVAALIRARTKDSNGVEIGTFDDTTRPTDAQAQEAIDHAVIALHEKVAVIGDPCTDVAKLAASYGAAAEIELSYFPEQARTDRSPYQYLLQRYEQLLTGVEQCVLGNLPGHGGDVSVPFGHGTMLATSGVVNDHYTGRWWPVLSPVAPPPVVNPLDPDDE